MYGYVTWRMTTEISVMYGSLLYSTDAEIIQEILPKSWFNDWPTLIQQWANVSFSRGMKPSTAGVESTSYTGKHKPWAQCMRDVGPASWTMEQHYFSTGSTLVLAREKLPFNYRWSLYRQSVNVYVLFRIYPDQTGFIRIHRNDLWSIRSQSAANARRWPNVGTAAQHCTTQHCTAMQCNKMQCNKMQCNAMQCNAMHNQIAIGSHCKKNRFYYTTTSTTDSLLTIFN